MGFFDGDGGRMVRCSSGSHENWQEKERRTKNGKREPEGKKRELILYWYHITETRILYIEIDNEESLQT